VSHPVDALVDGTGQTSAPPTVAPPDWPDAPAGPPPPGLPAATDRVVLRGDCLWDIAEAWLAAAPGAGDAAGTGPTDAQVLAAVRAWWQTNAAVIGPDPDLLLPGQVLNPPPR
jgi:nucleoid-associated protein YgaU